MNESTLFKLETKDFLELLKLTFEMKENVQNYKLYEDCLIIKKFNYEDYLFY
jgi:hypothetical protein